MSRKANRLRARLTIERDRALRAEARLRLELRRLAERDRAQDAREAALRDREKRLDRSVAMRMRVEEQFERPFGPRWMLNIEISPEMYRYRFVRSAAGQLSNASHFAAMTGRDAGKQIEQVIFRCLTGELKDFAKAL